MNFQTLHGVSMHKLIVALPIRPTTDAPLYHIPPKIDRSIRTA